MLFLAFITMYVITRFLCSYICVYVYGLSLYYNSAFFINKEPSLERLLHVAKVIFIRISEILMHEKVFVLFGLYLQI